MSIISLSRMRRVINFFQPSLSSSSTSFIYVHPITTLFIKLTMNTINRLIIFNYPKSTTENKSRFAYKVAAGYFLQLNSMNVQHRLNRLVNLFSHKPTTVYEKRNERRHL